MFTIIISRDDLFFEIQHMIKITKKETSPAKDSSVMADMPWYKRPSRNFYILVMVVFGLLGVFVAYEISTIIYIDWAIKNGQVPVNMRIINLIRFIVWVVVGVSSVFFGKKAYKILYMKK